MEPLFTNQTANTYEEYKRWNYAINRTKLIAIGILYGILFLLLLLLNLVQPGADKIFAVILFVIFMVLLFAVFILAFNSAVKKAYDSNRALQKCPVITTEFYSNYLESKNEQHYSKYFYEDIYRIVETQTNFYIMPAINTSIIITKQNCSPELIIFLQTLKNNVNAGNK